MLPDSTSVTPADMQAVLDVLVMPKTGEIISLDSGRWPGMPLWSGHPPFQVLTYRSPAGIRAQGDQEWLASEVNKPNLGMISEMVMGTCHSGTHIDGLAHFTSGDDNRWNGGTSADEALGDFGPLQDDASTIPALVRRGVLIDVAAAKGVSRLGKGYGISADDLRETLAKQEVELRQGDVVLVRTGLMSVWPSTEEMEKTKGAGVGFDAAEFLVEKGAVAVGADTESCEVVPSQVPGNPHPVHELLLIENGVYIIENVYLEELAARQAYEFLFVALPLKIRGTTASMIRPIAIL